MNSEEIETKTIIYMPRGSNYIQHVWVNLTDSARELIRSQVYNERGVSINGLLQNGLWFDGQVEPEYTPSTITYAPGTIMYVVFESGDSNR